MLVAGAAPPDPAAGVVELLRARQAYAANAAVLRSTDEMAQALLRRSG